MSEPYLPQSVDTRETRRDLVPLEYAEYKPAAAIESSRTAVTPAFSSTPSTARKLPAMQPKYDGLERIFGGGRDFGHGEFTDSFDIVYDGAVDKNGKPLNPATFGRQIGALIPNADAVEQENRERNAAAYFDRHQQSVVQKMADDGTLNAAMQGDPLQLSDQRSQGTIPQRKANNVGEQRFERAQRREEQRRDFESREPTAKPSSGDAESQPGGNDGR